MFNRLVLAAWVFLFSSSSTNTVSDAAFQPTAAAAFTTPAPAFLPISAVVAASTASACSGSGSQSTVSVSAVSSSSSNNNNIQHGPDCFCSDCRRRSQQHLFLFPREASPYNNDNHPSRRHRPPPRTASSSSLSRSQRLLLRLCATTLTAAASIAEEQGQQQDSADPVSVTTEFPSPAAAASAAAAVVVAETTKGAAAVAVDASASASASSVVPLEVEALDGIESSDEAHNNERPARKSLKKKGPTTTNTNGKGSHNVNPWSEFSVGDWIPEARVKAITAYGAFLDIGAPSDALVHISQLSTEFVTDVKAVLTVGQVVSARILTIDTTKNQVALTLLTEAQEAASSNRNSQDSKSQDSAVDESDGSSSPSASSSTTRRRRTNDNRSSSSSNSSSNNALVQAALLEKGWDDSQFVTGTVVRTVDFGAFVRVDASQLNAQVSGAFDGLVHISCLTAGRAASVKSVVQENDSVQVRVKSIVDQKVSLSMITADEEQASRSSSGGGSKGGGRNSSPYEAKDWQESLNKIQAELPQFHNRPLVVDLRGS